MGRPQYFKPVVVDQYNDLYREGGGLIKVSKTSSGAGSGSGTPSGGLTEDQTDPGFFLISGNALIEDPSDPGTYIVGG